MKYSSDTTGNGTRDIPAYSVLPQPTVPPKDMLYQLKYWLNVGWKGNLYTQRKI
jgi:hypothetical protein